MYPRLRSLKEDHDDFTQSKLVKILGVSQTGYSKYETGENDIPTYILIALADYYNTSIDYLLGRTDNPQPYHK
ncbi:MAG: helix-turn-helix transcriptional regulator [Bacilli bacterium]|nr:helix-turn-helix transcriptional regulator [Bacilli bacterium]